jgi:hypothetical protein
MSIVGEIHEEFEEQIVRVSVEMLKMLRDNPIHFDSLKYDTFKSWIQRQYKKVDYNLSDEAFDSIIKGKFKVKFPKEDRRSNLRRGNIEDLTGEPMGLRR